MTYQKADALDALKREAVQWYKERFDRSGVIGMPSDREVLFGFIDHLAQRGMLRGGWRAIESAPTDGTEFLVSDGELIEVVRWSLHRKKIVKGTGYKGMVLLKPTHWMPLPAAPGVEE